MKSINLKNFILRKDIANNINGVIGLTDDFIRILDANDNVIIVGDGDKKTCLLEHEIRLVGKVIGRVIGGGKSEVIASLITTLIQKEYENNELARETLNRYKELALLQNTAEKITSNLTLHEVAELIITEALKKIPATGASVMLMNKETGLLETILAQGIEYKNKLQIKAGEGIAGNIFMNSKAEIINNVSSDPRFIKNNQKMSSMMCAPLMTGNNVFGVINISSEELKFYTSADLKLFDTLALHGALAISNARYTEELTNHRDNLEEVVKERTSDLAVANEELKREIEERKIAETRIKDAKNEAEAANQAKSLFLATMSNELRTPLNAIISYSNILKNDSNVTRESQQVLNTIEKSGSNLLETVNDILDISKIEAKRIEFEPSDFNLPDLINHLKNLFKLKCDQKGLDLQVEFILNNGNMFVNGDSKKLRQVLINLLSNAVKFTESGYIKLSVKREKDNNFLFSIKDTGHGIDLNSQIETFGPVRQTESGISKGGSGLGLSISSKQIEIMGGKLTVKSEVNTGACFFFTLNFKPAKGKEIKNFTNNSLYTNKKPDLGGFLKIKSGLRAITVDEYKTNRNILPKKSLDIGAKSDEAWKYKDILKNDQNDLPDLTLMNSKLLENDAVETLKTIKSGYADKTKIEASPSLDKKVKTVPVLELAQNINEDLILRIKNAAEFYKVTELENCLNDIEKLGPESALFLREIRSLVENYDMEGILNALKT